jgi:outer membrane protein OmpA-like peptidoglycan-associated protein
MKTVRPLAALMPALTVGLLSACGPQHVQTPERPARTTIVLLPDPGRGTVGRAVVSSMSETADLAMARASTSVSAGQPPGPVTVMSEADAQLAFADVLSTLPLPARNFTLFFRFESNELTAESAALVPQILQAVKDQRVPEVAVIGHTDTTGAAASNFELALQRARTVRKLLLDAGIDGSLIDVTSHGEADPLVPTADQTYEPRNRRTEITVR